MLIRLVPFFISSLLIGAHFFRSGQLGPVIVCLLFPLLLLSKKRWALLACQYFIFFSSGIWIQTAITFVRERIAFNEDWASLVVILGSVILFSLWSGLLLTSKRVSSAFK